MSVDYDTHAPIGVALEELCANVDGVPQRVVPVIFHTLASGHVTTVFYDGMGQPITGAVTAANPCDCPAPVPCSPATTCHLFRGWDYFTVGDLTPGDTSTFYVVVNGVVHGSATFDYLVQYNGVDKSSFYGPLVTLLNTIPDITWTLHQDFAGTAGDRVEWRIEYANAGVPLELVITSTYAAWKINIDAAGNFTFELGDTNGTPNDPLNNTWYGVDAGTPMNVGPCP